MPGARGGEGSDCYWVQSITFGVTHFTRVSLGSCCLTPTGFVNTSKLALPKGASGAWAGWGGRSLADTATWGLPGSLRRVSQSFSPLFWVTELFVVSGFRFPFSCQTPICPPAEWLGASDSLGHGRPRGGPAQCSPSWLHLRNTWVCLKISNAQAWMPKSESVGVEGEDPCFDRAARVRSHLVQKMILHNRSKSMQAKREGKSIIEMCQAVN